MMNETQSASAPLSPHAIKHVLSSREPGMVLLKYVLILVLAAMGLIGLQFSARSLARPNVYRKDFIQEYLLARAVHDGMDPYLPLPELALHFLGPLPNQVLQHPTPHPPAVALLSLPLALLSYEQAAVLWFLFEILCMVAAVYLLLRWWNGKRGWIPAIFVTLLSLGWSPVWVELITGQLMTLLLLLSVGAWLALREEKEVAGGILLALSFTLKLITWPIIVFLIIRKRWRAVIAAGIATMVIILASALLMGFDRALSYYWEVGAEIPSLYRGYQNNLSLWSIGWRVFEGTGSSVVSGFQAPPLVAAPDLARLISLAIPLISLGTGLALASLARSLDTSFGLLICVSILASPVSWRHYLVLAAIPLAVMGRRLISMDWPKRETNLGLLLGVLLLISADQLNTVILLLSGLGPTAGTNAQVPFAAAMLSFIPTAAILGLLWLLWRLERVDSQHPGGAVDLGGS